jgi:hypothetical protein
MEPATPAAIVVDARAEPRSWRTWALVVLIPAPWLALLLSGSAHAVLLSEPLWVKDLVAGQLMAVSVFIALGGSAWAWRRIFDPRAVAAQAVVASHALYLAVLGLSS